MSFYSRPCCEWPIFFGNPLSEHGGYNYECACISSKYLIFLGIGHKYKPTSVLLKGSDSEKLRALNIRVISGEFLQQAKGALLRKLQSFSITL